MKVYSCTTAQDFFSAWPGLCQNANRDLEVETAIATTFSEILTQTAFMSLTARQKEFEVALRVQTAHLKILTRWTEPLSPSCANSTTGEAVLDNGTPDDCSPSLPTPSLPCVGRSRLVTPQIDDVDSSPTMEASPVTSSVATHLPATELLPSHPTQINSINSTPCNNLNLCIVAVNFKKHCFNVLRLSPGPKAPPTPFDIILPPTAAFYKNTDGIGALYPSFTAATCGWHAIFECIVQPSLLWECWGPGSLGEYPDVMSLYKSWNEGAVIERVGQKPPLRLVDAQWGCHKDQRSNKGHLPAWRPRRDDNVSDTMTWSQLLIS